AEAPDRIMFDNFTPDDTRRAVELVHQAPVHIESIFLTSSTRCISVAGLNSEDWIFFQSCAAVSISIPIG
ncbi:MAG: hypothetical protein SPL20_10885, partial [Fibrobacter sp.]|nr:hypothetical protein [Fibrobacter sp.]